jgi:hypothetical protein
MAEAVARLQPKRVDDLITQVVGTLYLALSHVNSLVPCARVFHSSSYRTLFCLGTFAGGCKNMCLIFECRQVDGILGDVTRFVVNPLNPPSTAWSIPLVLHGKTVMAAT